ncbi:MAG TPA: metallophosphoesterase [Polyangia bacterium]|jgi:hypothetical protein
MVPLIARGDAVRVLSSVNGDCPAAFGDANFDDSAWKKVDLPMPSVPTGGLCLRASFNIGDDIAQYRWLTITLSTPTRALLNAGKPLDDNVAGGGLDWSTDDDDLPASTPPAQQNRYYTLDLRLFPSLLQPERNVLALEIPATNSPVDISAVLQRDDVAAESPVQVTKGPYRLQPSPTSTRIAWESDRSAPSWLVVDGREYDGGWAMHHEVEIDNLVAGRDYSFYVATAQSSALPADCEGVVSAPMAKKLIEPNLDDDQFWKYLQRRDACGRLALAIHSVPLSLRPMAAMAPVRVAIVGDTRAVAGSLPTDVIDAVTAEAPDLVVHTGDVVSTGADTEWQTFFDASAALLTTAPLAPVPGEHDLTPWGDRFGQLFGVGGGAAGRAYSIDLGAVHIALLDSTANLDAQATWLDADLTAAEAKGALHEIVVLHWGPWTAGARGTAALADVVPIARRHGVVAIVSGHENIYEHGLADGLDYFITGGAGATQGHAVQKPTTVTSRALPHYLVLTVDGNNVTMSAKDLGGVVFDQVSL